MVINPVIEDPRLILRPPTTIERMPPPVNSEGPTLNVLEIAPGLAVEIRYINNNWQLVPTSAPVDVEGMIVDRLATKLQDPAISYDEICCLLNALANRRDSLTNAWRNAQGLLGTDKPLPLTEIPPLATVTLDDLQLNELPTAEETGIDVFDEISYSYKPEKDKILIMNTSGYRGRTWRPTAAYIDKRFDCFGNTYTGALRGRDASEFDDVVLIVCGQWGSRDDPITSDMYNLLFNELGHIPKLIFDSLFAARIAGLGNSLRYFGVNVLTSTVDIVNNSHTITEGYPLGEYHLIRGPQMYGILTNPTPGYTILAEHTYTTGIWPPRPQPPGVRLPGWPPAIPGEVFPQAGVVRPGIYTGQLMMIGGNIGFWGLWYGDPLLDRMIDYLLPAGQGCTIELTQTCYDN